MHTSNYTEQHNCKRMSLTEELNLGVKLSHGEAAERWSIHILPQGQVNSHTECKIGAAYQPTQ